MTTSCFLSIDTKKIMKSNYPFLNKFKKKKNVSYIVNKRSLALSE